MNRQLLQALELSVKAAVSFAFATSLLTPAAADELIPKQVDRILIESFSPDNSKGKPIPKKWRASRDNLSMFTFGNEGNNYFTRVTSKKDCTSMGMPYPYSSEQYPILNWSWRVHELPNGATELEREKNDSGAGLYVIFKGPFKFNNIIKYVWSSSLPVGAHTPSPYNKNTKIVVLQSGVDKINTWVTESVNIYEDYKRLFGCKPPKVEGFGILTDSDNTKSSAIADYDDITLSTVTGAMASSN